MLKKIKIVILIIFSFISSLFSQVNTNDSLILVELFNATNGQNWLNKSNWLTGNVNTWHGITVANNRVVKILLDGNNLNGVIPDTIGYLDTLLNLALSSNQNLSGTIPNSIGNLINLRTLSFGSDTSLSGEIPNTIGNLINLTNINLNHCNLIGSIPESIGNLNNLKSLTLSFNQLTGLIPSTIGNMISLQFINLRDNQLQKDIPESICNLSNLYSLLLENNNLTGNIPSSFGANMSNLYQIYLSNNQLSGAVPASLVNCSQYLDLQIANNNFTDLPDLSSLGQWYAVDAPNNKLTFEDLEPNIISYAFGYIPQDSALTPQNLTARLDSIFTLSSTVGGTANHYQWFKNGDTLQGATDSILYFPFVAWADSGVYTCHITNDIVTGLTLTRHPITLNVSDTITSNFKLQTSNLKLKIYPNPITSGNDFTIYCSETNTSSVIEIYNITGELICSKPAQTNRAKINTANLGKGIFLVKCYNDNVVCGVEKLIIF